MCLNFIKKGNGWSLISINISWLNNSLGFTVPKIQGRVEPSFTFSDFFFQILNRCVFAVYISSSNSHNLICSQPELLVRIEPHLFEWFGWYGNCAPRMMSPHDLRACGYQVDVTYRPLSSSADFDPEETISNYYERTGGLTKRILSQHKSKGQFYSLYF